MAAEATGIQHSLLAADILHVHSCGCAIADSARVPLPAAAAPGRPIQDGSLQKILARAGALVGALPFLWGTYSIAQQVSGVTLHENFLSLT